MWELFDGWKFLAGLGIFLFGMFMMEESIKLLAGRSFKILIRRCTESRFKGLLTGFVTTAILQSRLCGFPNGAGLCRRGLDVTGQRGGRTHGGHGRHHLYRLDCCPDRFQTQD